ncbi:hypothetical protein HPB48_007703 [Haemaphysalis longicornis]|uniref:XPG-I domain-containing protein n=1 Tax=Haemaphysalis longicornis TaxID=44386 RepID=A0A9J6G5E1_HAELO|nr:hypothetical protein HPB48_007703 [Haemaphysalis longicornis]
MQAARQDRRVTAQQNAQRKARLLLLKSRHRGSKRPAPKAPLDDLYVLPPLPEHWDKLYKVKDEDEDWRSGAALWELASLDCDSEEFASLPAETRHRALMAMQHRHRWGPSREAPEDSEAFSAFQLQGLLHKRSLQQRAEEARREMRPEPLFWSAEAQVSRVASQPGTHQVMLSTRPPEPPPPAEAAQDQSPVKDWRNPAVTPKEKDSAETSRAPSSGPALSVQDPAVLKWLAEECSPQKAASADSSAPNKNCTSLQASEASTESSQPPVKRVVDFRSEQDEPKEDASSNVSSSEIRKQAEKPLQTTVAKTAQLPSGAPNSREEKLDSGMTDNPVTVLRSSSPLPKPSDDGCEAAIMDLAAARNDEKEPDQNSPPTKLPDAAADQEDSSVASNWSGSQDERADILEVTGESEALDDTSSAQVLSDDDEEEKDPELLAAIQASLSEQKGEPAPSSSDSFWKPPRTAEEERELCMREEELEQEAARQARHAASINDMLVKECQELLALLGQPYVVSPGEAEAQCAWLEQQGLSHGTVTDDSDAWLFGHSACIATSSGPTGGPPASCCATWPHSSVGVSLLSAHGRAPSQERCLSATGLDRQKLVAFALLCGSDYTTGVNGVGPVTAMEVISEFKGDDAVELLEAFSVSFMTWLEQAKEEKVVPGSKTRSHLVRLSLEPGFPSGRVVQAYLEPTVDESREAFSWGTPDLDALRTYPFTRMDQYLEAYQAPLKPKLFPSKRLTKALGKLAPAKRAKLQEPQLSEDSDSS